MAKFTKVSRRKKIGGGRNGESENLKASIEDENGGINANRQSASKTNGEKAAACGFSSGNHRQSGHQWQSEAWR